MKKGLIHDMRDEQHGFSNWTAMIAIKVLKEKLKMDCTSYLTNDTSLFTLIKKTRSNLMINDEAIDINLMPPMIIKNCLPFKMRLSFKDSSGVK